MRQKDITRKLTACRFLATVERPFPKMSGLPENCDYSARSSLSGQSNVAVFYFGGFFSHTSMLFPCWVRFFCFCMLKTNQMPNRARKTIPKQGSLPFSPAVLHPNHRVLNRRSVCCLASLRAVAMIPSFRTCHLKKLGNVLNVINERNHSKY